MYILFAIIAAILLSAFPYLYNRKAPFLFLLRGLTYFAIFLLLLPIKIEKQKKKIQKPVLYVLADQTESIKKQSADKDLKNIWQALKKAEINKHFDTHFYTFDTALHTTDTLSFTSKKTDIAAVLQFLKNLHQSDQTTPVILLTDGQSTQGQSYVYQWNKDSHFQFFPIAFGDTIKHNDVAIDLLNVNPFVYKGNRFQVEIFTSYSGKKKVQTQLVILQQDKTVYKKNISFSDKEKTQQISILLPATSKGFFSYQAYLQPISNEKNRLNNRNYFSVEVLDNVREILLLSSIIHPDLGVIKRSLKRNKYLQIELKNPKNTNIDYKAYQAVVLYQPTKDFASAFDKISQHKMSWWMITGSQTDWDFLNARKLFFSKQSAASLENYFPRKNTNFSLFKLPDLKTDILPPLVDKYGYISLKGTTQTAFFSNIKGVNTQQALWVFNSSKKQSLLAGENLWKWAMQSGIYKKQAAFDQMLQQTIRYLSLADHFDRIKLQYQRQFYQGGSIVIGTQILNKNLEINPKAHPVLSLQKAGQKSTYPMSFQGDFYKADLSNLSPGTYGFTVSDATTHLKKMGSFVVLNYNAEAKNPNANMKDLKRLAQATGGKLYNKTQIEDLLKSLSQKKYPDIIHISMQKQALVNYRLLLFLIVLFLGLEWFIKKMRGEV